MPALDDAKTALKAIGFTIVEAADTSFVAVRNQFHWDCFTRLYMVVRVTAGGHFDVAAGKAGHKALDTLATRHDTSRIPRGFQQGWHLIDVHLADSADDAGLRWAGETVGKNLGTSYHTAVLVPGGKPRFATPIWGAAFWPKIRHIIDTALSGRATPTPLAPMALAITVLVFAPTVAMLSLLSCGLPVIVYAGLCLSEKKPTPAIGEG